VLFYKRLEGIKMLFVRILPLMLVLITGSAFAYDYKIDLKGSMLENAAYSVADKLRHETGYSFVSSSARQFAREVSHFRRVVRTGVSAFRVRSEFKYLRRKFYKLMSSFKHAQGAHISHNVNWSINKLKHNYKKLREEVFHDDKKYDPTHWNYPNG